MITGPKFSQLNGDTTLFGALDSCADQYPERGITIVDERGNQEFRTYVQIRDESHRIAVGLTKRNIGIGDRVLFALPTSFDFVCAFLGATRIGAVPVPIAPPREDYQDASDRAEFFSRITERLATVAALFGANAPDAMKPPPVGDLKHVFDVPELLDNVPSDAKATSLADADTCYLQTTSGTTGTRRAVVLTHENIIRSIHGVGMASSVTSDDVPVAWLPLYNIFGLIGVALFSVYWKLDCVLIEPNRFIQKPEEWLNAISRHGGTMTAAPSHAFYYAVRRCQKSQLEDVSLASLRVALVGGEPVRDMHISAFRRRFESLGLSDNTFASVYGMSECTLCVSYNQPEDWSIDYLDRSTVEQDEPLLAIAPDVKSHLRMKFASTGTPIAGTDIMIVDTRGIELDDRRLGEIAVRGPNVCVGYANTPHNMSQTGGTRLSGEWLMTGDVGYIADGSLYVVGRNSDRIFAPHDRVLFAEELEFVVNAVDGVRSGCVAIFDAGDKRFKLVVAVETQPGADETEIDTMVRSQLYRYFRIEPFDVRCVSPHSIPKSPSGKVRRHLAKAFYLSSILERENRVEEFDGVRRFVLRSRQEILKLGKLVTDRAKKLIE